VQVSHVSAEPTKTAKFVKPSRIRSTPRTDVHAAPSRPTYSPPAANGIRVVHQHEDGQDAGPDDPEISAAAGRPPRGMRSGAHRARADEGMQAHDRCSSSPKFRLAAYQRSSGRLYVGGIKSVETSVQGVHAKMHDDDGHAPAGVVLRIYFQISISPLCENLPDAGK
jgi:hypothetical protein